jgi:hypothetical protein
MQFYFYIYFNNFFKIVLKTTQATCVARITAASLQIVAILATVTLGSSGMTNDIKFYIIFHNID